MSGGGKPLVGKVEGLGSLGDGTSSGSSQEGKSELGKGKSLEWIQYSWEVAVSVDEHLVVLGNINDNHHLSVICSEVDECNSTWFNDVSNALKTTKVSTSGASLLTIFE